MLLAPPRPAAGFAPKREVGAGAPAGAILPNKLGWPVGFAAAKPGATAFCRTMPNGCADAPVD